MDESQNNNSFLYFILAVVLILIVSAYLFRGDEILSDIRSYLGQESEEINQNEQMNSARDLYAGGNSIFATAEATYWKGSDKHGEARTLYEQALVTAQGKEQEAHIQYKIALTFSERDPAESIRRMKLLVDNPDYPNQQKAYAIQHMYTAWKLYGIGHDKDELMDAIFSGEPYVIFLREAEEFNDPGFAFFRLNEYASTFGSAPYSNISAALYQASKFLELEENSPQRLEYLDEINNRINDVEAYINRNKDFDPNASLEPRIRLGIADVYGILTLAGVSPYNEGFSTAYERAIQLFERQSLEVSLGIRYAWVADAVFDEDDGESWERAEEYLQFALENIESYPGVQQWLLQYKDTGHIYEERIEALAERSPAFSQVLTEIGW